MTDRIEIPDWGLAETMTAKVEQYVKIYVKPRPRWIPERLYRALMSRVVLYESLPSVELLPMHMTSLRASKRSGERAG